MNQKEIGEIRRRVRRDRSNMTQIYGCYVNGKKEIVSEFKKSVGIMPENEAERYFALFKRVLSGSIGKNLIDLAFETNQVAQGAEHKLLMDLRRTQLQEEALRHSFYEKIIENVQFGSDGYLILLGVDSYDVPFRSNDGEDGIGDSEETYTYLLCAVCPVKPAKANLRYNAEQMQFCDGGAAQVAMAPEVGFLFPAFDDRRTNIYNVLYYTHSPKDNRAALVDALFHLTPPLPAAEQKKSFEGLLNTLDKDCSLEVVQTFHEQMCQCVQIHKESKEPDALRISKEQLKTSLQSSGIPEAKLSVFNVKYDEVFGTDAELHPQNVINTKRFEIKTPDVTIQVDPEKTDLIETRVIGGVPYVLIRAEESVEVNGVSIHIGDT